MEMYDFFHQELTTLKARTGSLQWEKLNDTAEPATEINNLISYMLEECDKAPFIMVRRDVIQRVIQNAIITDPEFIGLNQKFVRKALNAWWGIYGDKIIQARDQQQAATVKVELTEEQKKNIDRMANNYRASLLQGNGFKSVPQVSKEEAAKEGAEWKSNLEQKAVSVTVDPDRKVYNVDGIKKRNDKIREYQEKTFRDKNPAASDDEVKVFLESMRRYLIPIPEQKQQS
jgi:hypothetical protein